MVKILSVDDEAPIELLMRLYFRRKIRKNIRLAMNNGAFDFTTKFWITFLVFY